MSNKKLFKGISGTSKPITVTNYRATNPVSEEVEPYTEQKLAQVGKVAPWGDNNAFPKFLDDKVKLSIDMESGFQTLTEFCYGLRVATYRETMVGGKANRELVYDDNFETFKEMYNFNEIFLQRAFYNYFRYANAFIELSFDSKGKIQRVFTKDSPWCRISTLNPETGLSEYMYQSAQWSQAGYQKLSEEFIASQIDKKLLSQIPLIDYRNPIGDIQTKKPKSSLMGWHIKDYSPGDAYYGKSPWYPILENGWLDIASTAPSMLKSYYQNLITIAHHAEINIDMLKDTIENWDELKVDAQQKHLADLQRSIDENLTGSGKAFKTLFSLFRTNDRGELEHELIINPVTNPTKDNSVIKDLQFASGTVNQSMRIDSSLTGSKVDGSKEADAGSEKRLANNLLHQRLAMVRDQVLYVLTIIKYVNGWDKSLKFAIEVDYQSTTDKVVGGQTTVTN
jgi:hypothetical protein